ncbi:ATP-binding protein [Microbacterium sp. G2-8]|uniref:sensor histidine kinase n=1 Tax=Microbacterium sp. G2-8 TaxID=2842454 RepID=UPI001C8A9BDF|nr:ATP-binding protein [Microbacterium sp. G2-8]
MQDDDRALTPGVAALAAEVAGSETIERAWSRVSRERDDPTARLGFTRTRIERAIQLAFAAGALVMGVQAYSLALRDVADSLPLVPLLAVIVAANAAAVVACVIGRGTRLFCGVFAGIFPVAIVVWGLSASTSRDTHAQEPWHYYLLTVATAAAVIAAPLSWQLVSVLGIPLLFAASRLVRASGAAEYWVQMLYDVSIALLLGLGLFVIAWVLRGIGSSVDRARIAAVDSYTEAAAVEAAERERIEVAGLMHDSVLAALISSARAEGDRSGELAVKMAREALNRLADADHDAPIGTNEPVGVASVAEELRVEIQRLGAPTDVVTTPDDAVRIPARAARALVLAATQAVANAVQHADAQGLEVTVRAADRGVRVIVRDRGPGFDLDDIPADRLGIRGSIYARVAAAGGHVDVDASAHGTVVTLSYIDEEDPS